MATDVMQVLVTEPALDLDHTAAAKIGLTARERDILRHLCLRLTDREIAACLGISPRTVETHVAHILSKLGAANRREAAAMAMGFSMKAAEGHPSRYGTPAALL